MTTNEDLRSLSLDDLATLYRMQAEICSKTLFPLPGFEPTFEAVEKISLEVERRGNEAARRLLDLLDHPDEWVRYFAARDAYEIDPARCHKVLVGLFEEGAMSSDWAMETLLYIDPTFHEQLDAILKARKLSPFKRSPIMERFDERIKELLRQVLASNSTRLPN